MINIIGGTYHEVCFEPYWDETYGSGLRACLSLLDLDSELDLNFHTFSDRINQSYLQSLEAQYRRLKITLSEVKGSPVFQYDHPLAVPRIYPRPDTLEKGYIEAEADNVIFYGILEGDASIKGRNVVYDPQSPANPIPFSKTGSTADSLAVVVNYSEAKLMSKRKDVPGIRAFFFEEENVDVLVLKFGPKGAKVFTRNGEEYDVPVFKTKSVWPIGSGDVFTAVFAYYWFKGIPVEGAALNASQATAKYCSTRLLQFSPQADVLNLEPLLIADYTDKTIYLAGPFFTFAERWLIDQIRTALQGIGLKVFSPFHDVGHGLAKDVVQKDIEGLESAGLVFAVLDGLDSGTLFEIGYAVARGIPVIAYVQNEGEESVKMLEGSNCMLERDLTTAVYKSFWVLSAHE
ncbi:PfkB family carbohydrate kinase [Pontibacter fetidus]|uniref:Nucleoside 2-deoxyribosyltransferase n=1 Tax=Pontibacter fetidus TaxID=2700082 RepID=A0A6B2H8H3_9BACT|nr:PfkB family carbohydrate kinase [Pontibacter fetidus]NDK57366.1 nucleoside 2-deoxyribosyltransferase [Pontibacter fetidus]